MKLHHILLLILFLGCGDPDKNPNIEMSVHGMSWETYVEMEYDDWALEDFKELNGYLPENSLEWRAIEDAYMKEHYQDYLARVKMYKDTNK